MTPGPNHNAAPPIGYRGGPLVMLLLLFAGWAMLRTLWWEDPFAPPAAALSDPPPAGIAPRSLASPILLAGVPLPDAAYDPVGAGLPQPWMEQGAYPANGPYYGPAYGPAYGPPGAAPVYRRAPRPQQLIAYDPAPEIILPGISRYPSLPPGAGIGPEALARAAQVSDNAPFLPAGRARAEEPAPAKKQKKPDRWSLDAWAFQRQGSSAALPVSQGRVPVYGASQAGAVLQYRLSRRGRHDPRLYLRAYQALVPGGEVEGALGASVRPFGKVPVRVAGEARYTRFATGAAFRPAAYAVTELAPIKLPMRTHLEAYAQGGWVGGVGKTYFADGQATVTGDLGFVGKMSKDAVRMSLGAGAWGGAQRGAQRLDVGPTVRFDFKVGRVPARVSVDWRHRVAGDAQPGSGISATISTGF